MSNCILCNHKSVVNEQESASRTIYNCPFCGIFVVSDLAKRPIKQNAMKISSFLVHRKLCGHNDIVFISFENNRVDKEYLKMTVEQILETYPATFTGRLEAALENLALKSNFPGDEVRVERQEMAPMLYVSHPGPAPFSFVIKSMQKFGWIDVSYFENSCFSCDISITTRGWQHYEEIIRGRKIEPVAFFSLPETEDPDKLHKGLIRLCNSSGLRFTYTSVLRSDKKLDNAYIVLLKSARVVVCDLSESGHDSYFIYGMARAMEKPCILTCSEKRKKKLMVDTEQISVIIWDTQESYIEKVTQAIQAVI